MDGEPRRSPLARVLLALAVATVATLGVTALFHLRDRHAISHVSGVWMALVQYARGGVIFPPAFEDGYYGATRYMPLSVLYQAAFTAAVDAPVLGGKLSGLVASAALGAVSWVAVRQAGASRAVGAALAATVLTSDPGFEATHSIRGDAFPLVLQVAALALALRARSHDGRGLGAAAVLVGLAPLAKTSAVWAGAGIALELVLRDRRAALRFVVVASLTLALGLGLSWIASEGRVVECLLDYGGVGGPEASWKKAPTRMNRMLMDHAPATWMLLPWALLAARRAAGPARAAGAFCLLVLLVVFADGGTYQNHLLDLAAAAAVLTASAWEGWSGELRRMAALCLVIGLGGSLVRFGGPELSRVGRELRGKLETADDLAVLDAALDGAERVLSEDPSLPVLRGERPVVVDPYIMGRIAERRPELAEQLAARIRRGEFDRIVLLVPLVAGDPWYNAHFGWTIAGAMLEAYEPHAQVAGYHVLRPRRVDAPAPVRIRTTTTADSPAR